MKKQWMAAASVAVLGNSLLAGFTSVPHADAKQPTTTITFYEAMPGAIGNELTLLTNKFMAHNPNIKVKLVFNGSYSTLQQKLTAAVASHTAPTISQVYETWTTEYNNDGLLAPVQNYLPKSTIKDIMPVWKADNSYNGKLLTAPFNKSDYVLYYNTDDFKKAGIKTPPKTWAQLEADSKKLTTGDTKGFGMNANWYTFEMFLNQAGGTVLSKNGQKAAFNNAAGNTAATFMKRLVLDDQSTTVVSSYLSDGFNTGKYAMDLDSVAAMSFISNPNTHWKVAPLPMGKKAAVQTAGTNIALFNSATPAQKAAAGKYIDFLISKQNTIAWAEATGYLPVRQSALTDPTWKKYVAAHPNNGVGPAELKYGYVSPRLAVLTSAENEATNPLGNLVNGKTSTASALSQLESEFNDALSGN